MLRLWESEKHENLVLSNELTKSNRNIRQSHTFFFISSVSSPFTFQSEVVSTLQVAQPGIKLRQRIVSSVSQAAWA